jgi:hypothetical protein
MNWLKKGPELKKPDFEAPQWLSDLYYDLRDRRLLPILALAVVAIAAVPFLLGGGSDEEEAPAVPSALGSGSDASGAEASHFTVVQSRPGLRDYRKRLGRRSPTDPFKQRYTTAPDLKGAELNPESPTETESTSVTEETIHSTTIESEGGSPSPGGSKAGGLVFFSWVVDVKITKSGGGGSSPEAQADGLGASDGGTAVRSPVELASDPEPTIRHKVLPLTKLPGDKQPVATYMGRSKHGFPLFLVSSKVKSVFGESKCVSGDDSCQLLEVAPNFPITFVYGPNEVRYTFNVLKIELAVTGHS